MPPLTVPGDPHVIDEAWNNSLVSADANAAPTGRFCAYCAQRAPPVLSRHRFTECMFRQLAGRPEFSQASSSRPNMARPTTLIWHGPPP
eukprot:1939996-Prymnesium_polylepis.1